MNKNNLGKIGESLAEKYLKEKNYRILDRNFQNNIGKRLGEIDLIAKENNEIVFIEVKTRELRNYQNTLPEENITYKKLKKLEKIAQVYLKVKKLEPKEYRFDAISVWIDLESKKAKIKHLPSL